MSNSQPLRRSRRGQKPAYGPGDRVEVVRDEGVAIGRLVRKVDQDSGDSLADSNVDHWIVSFEGNTEEHEVTEKYIGRLVESTDTESVKSGQTPPAAPAAPAAARSSRSSSSNHKTSLFGNSNINSSSSNNNNKSKKSSKSPPHKVSSASVAASSPSNHGGGEARPSTRSAIRKQGGKEKALLKGIKPTKKASRSKHHPKDENETVVKVKMLTGTLFLYRGEHPRAEFVRTV